MDLLVGISPTAALGVGALAEAVDRNGSVRQHKSGSHREADLVLSLSEMWVEGLFTGKSSGKFYPVILNLCFVWINDV